MMLLALNLPKLPIGDIVEWLVEWLVDNLSVILDAFSEGLQSITEIMVDVLLFFHPIVLIILVGLFLWLVTGKKIAIMGCIGLFLIYNLQLWTVLIDTVILILIAVIIALIIGVPIGIWMTRSSTVEKVVRPILDFMQTMPPFVYLIPAVMLFGIGVVPGLFATIIFAVPPPVRLTYLGITQVPEETKEMARAFGANDLQVLTKIELPLSLPSLMTGVNQCIMLGISMVVIAAMIGAGGLGAEVLRAVSRLDLALGFEAGLAIVILAMVLDAVSRNIGLHHETPAGRLVGRLKKRGVEKV
jgi:glycine betaine/proline transport system permease protein